MKVKVFGMSAFTSLILFIFPFSVLNQFLDGECGIHPNGYAANSSSSPWIAFLHTTDLTFVCGGTLISNKLILTAAHCIMANAQLVARLGEFVGNLEGNPLPVEHEVRESCKHPFYDIDSNVNDIAVLVLASNVVYTGEFGFPTKYFINLKHKHAYLQIDNIRPICIVWDRSWKRYIDGIQVLRGPVWFKPKNENDNGNRILEVRRQPPEMCPSSIGNLIATLSSSQFCAGNWEVNLCNVDCSSPLGAMVVHQNAQRFVQIGIATSNQRCNMPSTYTDVLSHIEFILRVWRYSE
ncbi:hypothetical protein KR084_005878, partial [Drosophila pseudotakahashii]